MKIHTLPMSHGDFILVEYVGISGKNRVIGLDSGSSYAYMHGGREWLSKFKRVDLWVLSHVHDDHIGGLIKYIDDRNGGLRNVPECDAWWFNCDRVNIKASKAEPSVQTSMRQASQVSLFLSKNYDNSHWNNHIYRGGYYDLDGMHINVLSPETVMMYNGDSSFEAGAVSVDVSVKQNNDHVKITDFDTDDFEEDSSEDNRNSVALLLEYHSHRFLWMADAAPSVVVESLKQLGYSSENPVVCDYMTLGHHGSKANTNSDLLSLIDCNRFIVTGNGDNRYGLPDKEAFACVIARFGENVELYTTQMGNRLRHIFDVDQKYRIEEKEVYEIHVV